MAARDHAVERVGDVEERGVAVGDGAVERQQVGGDGVVAAHGAAALEDLDGRARPDRPVSEQAADEAQLARRRAERHRQVEHDVVVVAGVERDPLLRARRRHAVHDVERAVAVERGDLDPDHVLDRGEVLPERAREDDAADRGLQVEADHGQLVGEGAAVGEHLLLARAAERREAHEHGVVAELARDPRLGDRLLAAPGDAGHEEERPRRPRARRLGRELEHRAVEPDVADRELRGVDADGETACPGVDVVARECALPALVETAIGVERERVGRDDGAGPERRERLGGDLLPVHQPSSGPAMAWTSSGVPGDRVAAERQPHERPLGREAAAGEVRGDGRRLLRHVDHDGAGDGVEPVRRAAPPRWSRRRATSGPSWVAVRPARESR